MNDQFMSDEELDNAIARAKEALDPVGYRCAREQELRELHHGALVQIRRQRQQERRCHG